MVEGGKARECQPTSATPFYNDVILSMSAKVSQAPPIRAHLSTLSCWGIRLYLSSSEHSLWCLCKILVLLFCFTFPFITNVDDFNSAHIFAALSRLFGTLRKLSHQ